MPEIHYLPQTPRRYRPRIGLIGCGGITSYHLTAYRDAGWDVVAMCDLDLKAAEARRREYYPGASVHTDYRELVSRDDIDVVDVTTHPPERPPIIRDCLLAKKHVLSQKPFVLDLDIGQELIELADRQGVQLAVNQNGRWAPHFAYIRAAVEQGLLGDLAGIHTAVHWDHTWTEGTKFAEIKHLVLYDFGIHWFDFMVSLIADDPVRVYASITRTSSQQMMPPLLAQAVVEFPHAQGSLVFDAETRFGSEDHTYVTGTNGTVVSSGPDLQSQKLTLTCREFAGPMCPELKGQWFPDGFRGTMGEVLCAIEEGRPCRISAESNLRSLALCFAAVASAEAGMPIVPGTVRKLPGT